MYVGCGGGKLREGKSQLANQMANTPQETELSTGTGGGDGTASVHGGNTLKPSQLSRAHSPPSPAQLPRARRLTYGSVAHALPYNARGC